MRVSQGGVSVWYGTPDAPAPSGVVAPGGDTSVTIGIEPPDPHASITVLYRINHGAPHTVAAQPSHQHAAGRQYFQAHLTGFKGGDKVEYVALYHSGTRQIPSNQEAERHVVTFTVGPEHATAVAGVSTQSNEAEELKETLHAVLRAANVLNSAALEQTFVKSYFEHHGDSQSFWLELAKHPELNAHIEQLQFALQIDLLTSGHLPLIEALVKMPGVKSMRDLAHLDDSVWHGLIEKHGVPHHVPGGSHPANAQFYASSILATLQAAFPTLTVWRIASKSPHVDPLAVKFLENSTDFDIRTTRIDSYADDHAEAAFKGIAPAKREAVLKEVKRLQRLFAASTNANVFSGLLESKLDSAHAIAIIPRATFVSHYGQILGGTAAATEVHERAQFINARNIHLRTTIHDVIHTPPTRGLGHHSQVEMLRHFASTKPSLCLPTHNQQLAAHSNLQAPHASVEALHANVQGANSNVQTSHVQASHVQAPHLSFQGAHLNFKSGSLKEDLVKRFPNSEELFGSLSLCNCAECESAIGPAAYLVDVLDFLGSSKRNTHNATPLDVLIGNAEKGIPGRRPDLAFLNLTCANTNTSMPYIDIVNEILESYVELGFKLDGSSARDSAGSTSGELDANPQFVNQRAYQILDQAVYPFTLPFNRPLLVARSYLNQLHTSRYEVLKTFHKDQASAIVQNLLGAEFLGLSAEEFQVLTGYQFDPNLKVVQKPDVEFYGYHSIGGPHLAGASRPWTQELSNAATFLQRTGISYDELRALASSRFVSPNQPSGQARQLLDRIPVSSSALTELLKSNLSHPSDALIAIGMAGISAHDLHILTGDAFNRIAKTVVIDDAARTCDPHSMKLRHFDGTEIQAPVFARMHKFIRLYRKTGWSISDLDRAISALGTEEITPELIVQLSHMKQLQQRLHVTSVQVLLALWSPIETQGADSLYRSLFLNKATHRDGAEVDAAFEQEFPDSPVLTNPQETLLLHLSVLQSALRLNAVDLGLILQDCGLDPATAHLDLPNVSAVYRRAALAKAFKLKVKDFLSLKTLSGLDPFTSPEETIRLATVVETVTSSGLTSAQLSYLIRHVAVGSKVGETEPHQAAILDLARNLRDGLTAISRDNVMVPDPTGSLTAQKLALLYDSSVVDDLVGVVNGTVNYSATLVVLPAGVKLPAQLAAKMSFDPIGQLLICKSPLTSADRSALAALSSDPSYLSALDGIYHEPLDLIKTALRAFLDVGEAEKKLVTETASLAADLTPIQLDAQGHVTTDPAHAQTTVIAEKYTYILRGLLPYLIVTLGAALLKKTISDSLKITGLMAQKLLDNLLPSRLDITKTAAFDLQSLQRPGLTAAYYPSGDQSGASTSALASEVAFESPKSPLPAGTGSGSWKGMVEAPAAGDFEFIVRTNGTPTLWVGDNSIPLPVVASPVTGEWISKKITLKARQIYYLRLDVEQLPATNPSVTLLWQSITIHKTVVPPECLYAASILHAFRETYILLQKAAILVGALKLTEDEVAFLAQTTRGLPALVLKEFPVAAPTLSGPIDPQTSTRFAAVLRAAQYVAFRRDLPVSDAKLTWLFDSADMDHAVATLVSVTGWDVGLVQALTGADGFDLSLSDFNNETWAIRLKECVRLSDRLGVSSAHLFKWSTISSDFMTLEKIGQDIKKSVQAQYEASEWLAVAKPLNDKLRDAQRNALIAYLLPRMELKDADQLFEYFLIDPQMGVCTETSRISLAHSTVQLFIQRCLMNLEDTGDIHAVRPNQIDSEQWEKWRKHYRIWQANYQVLLHPENWMEQGLRDDKTPFFKALEADLTQQDITAENVETAYLNYLEKLQQVARLEIIGTFWQDKDPDTHVPVNILHVFGRTFHSPHTYFYRTFVNFATWTPWEEMQVTIEGDHVMPMIWNRRLYVFWPTFVKKTPPPDHPASFDPTSKNIPVPDPPSHWQVSLAWTELKHNKWSAKQLSKNAFDIDPQFFVPDDPNRYAKYAYSFKTAIATQLDGTAASLVIRCVFHGPTVCFVPLIGFIPLGIDTTEVVGAFEVGGCNGESVEAHSGRMHWPNPITPSDTDVEALTYVLHPGKQGLTLTKAANQQPAMFLKGSPTPYRLLYPHQFADYLLQAPLFYQDKHSTFFVTPHEEHGPVHQVGSVSHVAFHRGGAAAATRAKAAATHSATVPHHSTAHTSPRPPRHPAPGDVSNVLIAMEKTLADIGAPFTRHSSGRSSAWGSHALSHNTHPPTTTKVKFETFYHPFVCEFMKSVTRQGINGLLTIGNQSLGASNRDHFARYYKPTDHVLHPLPMDSVDFENGPYAIYNQELFFHIPDLIHERLHQNKRYYDAIRWLKYIFDPTDDGQHKALPGEHHVSQVQHEPPPQRYWKYLPFKSSPRDNIQQLLAVMESGDEKHSQLISDWASHPFQPYAVARHRLEAYKKNIFIKYVRTLIDHGDTLFLSDSKEAINEAQQLYIMAAHLLGPKPEKIPPQSKPKPECYASLRGKLDTFAKGLALLENEYPFSGKVTGHPKADSGGLQNIGRTLYFCAPQNAKLLELWDIVADRLYKIRNCLNIEGVFRQLALFDPPIDPGMLVRAAALGIDLGSVMGDIQAPLPAYRFSYMLQKALEMCNECRSFGSALLSALEKNDAEALSVMRATHEVGILDLMHGVKIRQLDEANAQVTALTASRNTAAQRYSYYQTLMGVSNPATPESGTTIPLVPIPSQPTADIFGIQLIPEEGLEMVLSTAASVIQTVAGGTQALASVMYVIPQINAHVQPMGVGATAGEGGQQFGHVVEGGTNTLKIVGEVLAMAGTLSGKMGTYFRRQAEWALQNNLAACEIMQIDKQIAAANIRVEIAQRELTSHEKQMENAKTVLDYMTSQKFTNLDLYGWMISDTSSSYFACYQMAFALAKKAERTFRFERGLTDSNFIQFGYWDSLRKGLLAGDRLHLALLKMASAYTDQNTREYEISRDISILLNAPLALIALKETGMCEIAIPESFFDADYPGHYMRRIRNVSLSVPCVVGPYTSVNCRLTLLTNKTRISTSLGDQYAEDIEAGDDRFVNNFAAVQSIATSHGLNDAGLFELNFRDERYLPFEGAGVISRWRLEMPRENNAFDFESISDVILHFKYTSREGGEPLRQAARQAGAANAETDLVRLFSLRHEFSTNWYGFLNPNTAAAKTQLMTLDVSAVRFPYQYRGKTISMNKVDLFLKFQDLHDMQTFSQDGTPMGDYVAAKPLAVSLTPPGGTGISMTLKSDKSLLNGLPHASADLSDQSAGPGLWTIELGSDALTGLPPSLRSDSADKIHRLKSDVVMDMVIVFHYAVN